jgi:RNA polymerase sigma factor (sigma-70 family)
MTYSTNLNRDEQEQLILDNMGLVVSIARSLKPSSDLELEEYIQSGRIGLWKAIQKHNPKKGKLTTIAWYYIRWEIIGNMPSNKLKKGKKASLSLVNFTDIIKSKHGNQEEDVYHQAGSYEPLVPFLDEVKPSILSEREERLLDLRAAGYTMKEIGAELGRSPL